MVQRLRGIVQKLGIEVRGGIDGRVAAIVVNYNAAGHLAKCLSSIEGEGVETTVVVDNGSTDGSREVVRRSAATWLETGSNLGYGSGANAGSHDPAVSKAEMLLVANADTELCRGAVSALVSALDADRTLGIVGPTILNPDGSVYPSARMFPGLGDAIGHGLFGLISPRNRFTTRYRMLDWDHRRPAKVDWVSGSCFLIRRDAWDMLGGFDPAYFMYMEDVDLCWRARAAGLEVGYDPGAEVIHVQGVSAHRHPYRMLAAHHRSMWRFACRTTTGPARLALPLVGAGLVARLLAASLWHRFVPARLSRPAEPATGGPPSRPLP